ncbi:MAG: Spy/CpxP family protein refolding chaperone [Acidobacteria bacterium]|nr:Spy/CpxP family protein refolding chaperone [Acidobacteriota bacterium]
MKKGLIVSTIIFALAISLLCFSSVFAQGSQRQRTGSFRSILQTVFAIGDELRALAKDVNLSASQKQQIKTIVLTAKPQAQQLHSQLETKRKELRSALLEINPNQTQIQVIGQDIANISSQMVTFRIQTASQITQVLTPEQKDIALKDLTEIDPLIDQLKEEIQALAINSPLMK